MTINKLDSIDKNFIVKTNIEKEDICFRDVEEGVFHIYGTGTWKSV